MMQEEQETDARFIEKLFPKSWKHCGQESQV